MVKNITNFVVIALFVARLLTLKWPEGITGILTLASVVIFSMAAGVALSNLLPGGKKD